MKKNRKNKIKKEITEKDERKDNRITLKRKSLRKMKILTQEIDAETIINSNQLTFAFLPLSFLFATN